MLTPEEIKINYKKFDDWKIRALAQDAGALRKDVIPILNKEIIDRNLGDDLLIWVGLASNKFDGLERKNLIDTIRKEKCSFCFKSGRLEGYEFKTVVSYIIASDTKVENLIICTHCAKTKRINSITKTLFLGWWSRIGFLSTPFEIISSIIRSIRHKQEDEEIINLFIDNNTGRIRQSVANNDLARLIDDFNGVIDKDDFNGEIGQR